MTNNHHRAAKQDFRGPAHPFHGGPVLCQHDDCPNTYVVWNYGAGPVDPRLCREHLTEGQREKLIQAREQTDARRTRLSIEPECWSWPAPAARRYATEAEADDALSVFQLHRGCAICGDRANIVEDHDHATGLVRGNLCHACNIKEGKDYSTPPFEKYRERNPASILGVKVRYCSPFFGYAEPQDSTLTDEQRESVRAAIGRMSLPVPEPAAEPLPDPDQET